MSTNGPLFTDPVSGAYCIDRVLTANHKRYTVDVKYVFGEEPGDYSIEEIDVNALNEDRARTTAELALNRDYEDGGKIIAVREQIGWYM